MLLEVSNPLISHYSMIQPKTMKDRSKATLKVHGVLKMNLIGFQILKLAAQF